MSRTCSTLRGHGRTVRRDRGLARNQRRSAARAGQSVRRRQLVRDRPSQGRDALRQGRVDDAEDGEVILHELGHQIHFSQSTTFFATVEAGGISEGFGDYWAGTVGEWAAGPTSDPACIADWDAVSYTAGPVHCLRRLDRDLSYPEDLIGAVHRDGQIWSHALWNLRTAIGATHADTRSCGPSSTGRARPCRRSRSGSSPRSRRGLGQVRAPRRRRPSRSAGSCPEELLLALSA